MSVNDFSDYEKYHRSKQAGPDSQEFYWKFNQTFDVDPVIIQCEEDAMEYFSKEPGFEGVRQFEHRYLWPNPKKLRVYGFLKERYKYYSENGLLL